LTSEERYLVRWLLEHGTPDASKVLRRKRRSYRGTVEMARRQPISFANWARRQPDNVRGNQDHVPCATVYMHERDWMCSCADSEFSILYAPRWIVSNGIELSVPRLGLSKMPRYEFNQFFEEHFMKASCSRFGSALA
jgi:hypothetical protein